MAVAVSMFTEVSAAIMSNVIQYVERVSGIGGEIDANWNCIGKVDGVL